LRKRGLTFNFCGNSYEVLKYHDMKNKDTRYAQNHFWNSVKNLAGILAYFFCQWLILIIVIRIAGYETSGEFSLVISFTNLFGLLSQYNIRNFQLSDVNNRFLPQQYSASYIITSGLAVVSFLLALLFSGYGRGIILSCLIYMVFKLCETFTNYVFTYMQLENKYTDIAISYSLKGVVPLIGFAVWLYFTQSLFQALCIMSLLYIVIIVFYDIRKTYSFFPRGIVLKDVILVLKECFPMMLVSLILPFMLFITRYTVEKAYGATELGYYSAFTMVIVILSTMAMSVYQVILPVISEKYLKHMTGDIVRMIVTILGIIILAALIMILLARLIGNMVFSLVFGAEILGHMYLLLPVIITSVMLAIMSFTSVCLTAMQKRLPMLIGMLAGAVLLSVVVMPVTQSNGMLGTTNIFTVALCVIIVIHGFLIFRNLWSLA
jgi:O-antigen/teichoic acid export membrane protein